jgi:hypothetical protein
VSAQEEWYRTADPRLRLMNKELGCSATYRLQSRRDDLNLAQDVTMGLEFQVGGASLSRDRGNDNTPDVVHSSLTLPQASQAMVGMTIHLQGDGLTFGDRPSGASRDIRLDREQPWGPAVSARLAPLENAIGMPK